MCACVKITNKIRRKGNFYVQICANMYKFSFPAQLDQLLKN